MTAKLFPPPGCTCDLHARASERCNKSGWMRCHGAISWWQEQTRRDEAKVRKDLREHFKGDDHAMELWLSTPQKRLGNWRTPKKALEGLGVAAVVRIVKQMIKNKNSKASNTLVVPTTLEEK